MKNPLQIVLSPQFLFKLSILSGAISLYKTSIFFKVYLYKSLYNTSTVYSSKTQFVLSGN